MEVLKTNSMSMSVDNKVKTDSDVRLDKHSQSFNHQRVSVRDIIVDHYRKGK